MKLKQLGIIGFGTMGKNLALNFRDHGITVAVYETKKDVVQKFIVQNSDDGLTAFSRMTPFLENLRSPKIIIFLVPAGAAVDELLDDLIDLLSPNDILIDSGNSYYKDSLNRHHRLDEVGIRYIDMGISGGGKGARHGPSMMVGADSKTWNIVKPIIQAITLSTEFKGLSGDLVGPPGSGHFVKMVHNGIEYGIMELISEVYHVARISSLTNIEIARMFDDWNDNRLNSYLIKISSSILKKVDSVNPSEYLIDKILDSAEQKGTGRWSSLEALSLGIANPIIQSAVEQRSISSRKEFRVKLAESYNFTGLIEEKSTSQLIEDLENTLYLGMIMCFYEGLYLISTKSDIKKWELDLQKILNVWSRGSILSCNLINTIYSCFDRSDSPDNILQDCLRADILSSLDSLKRVASSANFQSIPVPAISATLQSLLSLISSFLPANMIQAQRDYFGSHGFVRNDTRETVHDTKWTD